MVGIGKMLKKGIKLWQAQVAGLQRYCNENWKNIFPESKLRGLHVYIRISVSDLYIPTIGLPIWLQQNRWTDPGNL